MTLAELADELGVQLDIVRAPNGSKVQFRCHLRCVTFPAKQGYHRAPYGWGDTPQEALGQYVRGIRGKTVVVHPYVRCKDHLRHEFFIPSDLASVETA